MYKKRVDMFNRMFPPAPDFYALLAKQSRTVTFTIENLHKYMLEPSDELAELLTDNEHLADTIKVQNLNELNRAFSTPMDREDIYRAIAGLDWIVTHCKSTINEMIDLDVTPDETMQQIVEELKQGSVGLAQGFEMLSGTPADSGHYAQIARHAHRRIERVYRHGLRDLFSAELSTETLKRREIYHHLMDGSRYLHAAANTLEDIMVKLI